VVDHLGAAIARVKWNGTYGPSDCTCWSAGRPDPGPARRFFGVDPQVTGGRWFGPTVPTSQTVPVVRWYEHSSYGGFPVVWTVERWEFPVDPVDLMGGHHRSRRARSAVSGNCC